MSLSLKLGSLFIRTAAKPVGNWIKHQAREHEPFRRRCIAFAQMLHRIDMKMRLGLLQDPAAIDRQISREAASIISKKRSSSPSSSVPTVPTEAEAEASAKEEEKVKEKVKEEEKKRKDNRMIRPLSEAKAIDSGATFISEAFLFLVAAGLIGFETWRARRKAGKERGALDERLERVEEELRRVEAERVRLVGLVDGFKREIGGKKQAVDGGGDAGGVDAGGAGGAGEEEGKIKENPKREADAHSNEDKADHIAAKAAPKDPAEKPKHHRRSANLSKHDS